VKSELAVASVEVREAPSPTTRCLASSSATTVDPLGPFLTTVHSGSACPSPRPPHRSTPAPLGSPLEPTRWLNPARKGVVGRAGSAAAAAVVVVAAVGGSAPWALRVIWAWAKCEWRSLVVRNPVSRSGSGAESRAAAECTCRDMVNGGRGE
jgi:hypothetical protein